jgi:hypothetical protein
MNENDLIGDINAAPIDSRTFVEGGAAPPEYGDALDIDPQDLSVGDVYSLEDMGDPFETGAFAPPSAFSTFSGQPKVFMRPQHTGFDRGTLVQKPSPRTTNAIVALGRKNASMMMTRAGVSSKGSQATLQNMAETTARLNRLGARALGKIAPSDFLPFSYAEMGRLHTVRRIREGAGLGAETLRTYLNAQLLPPYLPFRRQIASAILPIGGTLNLAAFLGAASTAQYGAIMFIVRLSAPYLTLNPNKVLTLSLSSGVGGVVAQNYQEHIVSYDRDGVCQLFIVPGFQVDGNYWPRLLPLSNGNGVPANTLDINFTLTGNDGTSDTLTVFAIGPDDFYYRQMMNRLAA